MISLSLGLFDLGPDPSPVAQDDRLVEGPPSHKLFKKYLELNAGFTGLLQKIAHSRTPLR